MQEHDIPTDQRTTGTIGIPVAKNTPTGKKPMYANNCSLFLARAPLTKSTRLSRMNTINILASGRQ